MPKDMSFPMRLLFALLPGIEKEFGIDPSRRYIMGLSMGGYGTWDALCRRPDYFAAAVPICGGADEEQAERIAGIPVWVFHGALDQTVPTIRSRNIVAALKKAGGNPIYSECAGVNHASWKNALAEPDLLKWLFNQKRAQSDGKKEAVR
jgi:predicted peptidase